MDGLKRIFLRLTPIIMLICFICFGITHTFQQTGQANLTYLSKEIITLNDNGTPQNTADDLTIEQYKFDAKSYVENIDQDILKRATTNTIQLNKFNETLNSFNLIWQNGYNLGDIGKTIANGIILIVNTVLTVINIIITPLRISAGILLTGFSLLGINITRETPIITALNTIMDSLAIPLINPITDKQSVTELTDTAWLLNTQIEEESYGWRFNFDIVDTELEHSISCKEIDIHYSGANSNYIKVWTIDNEDIVIYRNGQWINDWRYGYLKIIWIIEDVPGNMAESLSLWLNNNATQYTIPEE